VLEALHSSDPQPFEIYALPKSVGEDEAVRQGSLQVYAGSADYVGHWGAYLATPLEAIPAFCHLLDARPGLRIIFGARVRLLGRTIERRAVRHYLGRVLATAAPFVLGVAIYDTQCGAELFLMSPEIWTPFRQPFVTRWLFDVELLARRMQARRAMPLQAIEDILYGSPFMQPFLRYSWICSLWGSRGIRLSSGFRSTWKAV
jgi:dolichyl-phosphate beta-glucosyltransferase